MPPAFSFQFSALQDLGPQGYYGLSAFAGAVSGHWATTVLFISLHSHFIFIMCNWSHIRHPPTENLRCNVKSPLSIFQKSEVLLNSYKGKGSIMLPFFIEGSDNLCATGVVSSTYSTLVILKLWSDNAVTAGSHASPPHTHRITVGSTFSSIRHLKHDTHTHISGETILRFFGKLKHLNLRVLSIIGPENIWKNQQPSCKNYMVSTGL